MARFATEAHEVSFKLFGTQFDGGTTDIKRVIEEAKLDYQVESQPLVRIPQNIYDAILRGEAVEFNPTRKELIGSKKATIRTDVNDTLGIVGSDYGIVQNSKAFEFIDFIKEVSGTDPIIESAGSLGYGERVYISAKLGEDSYLEKGDAINNYVVFTNAHDGSGAVMAFFTPIRVVCQNTLNMAIKGCPNKVIFKHTKNVNHRLNWELEENRKKALEVFSKSVKFSQHFMDAMLNLKAQNVTAEQVENIVHEMYLTPKQFNLWTENNRSLDGIEEVSTRLKNQISLLKDSIEFGVGQDRHRGTKLWVLNGLTTMLHNDKAWKSSQDEYKSLMEGDGLKKTQKMFELLQAA